MRDQKRCEEIIKAMAGLNYCEWAYVQRVVSNYYLTKTHQEQNKLNLVDDEVLKNCIKHN